VIEVVPLVPPKAEVLPNLSVPTLIVVVPVYVFVPERINVPVPL